MHRAVKVLDTLYEETKDILNKIIFSYTNIVRFHVYYCNSLVAKTQWTSRQNFYFRTTDFLVIYFPGCCPVDFDR